MRSTAALVVAFAGALTLSVGAQNPPPQQAPPPQPPPIGQAPRDPATPPGTPGAAPAKPGPIVAPPLPRDARMMVDQATQQLIDQLKQLHDAYMQRQRPEDAALVATQIDLLRQATGLPEDGVRPERVNLALYRDRTGETFEFTITGSADYPIWGTGIYTDESALETAAVHAGVLRSGQTGKVRVTILPARGSYAGSRSHGIDSMPAGSAAGSFGIEVGGGSMSKPTSITNFRGRTGEVLVVPTVGTKTGSVWGVDIYTDDSNLGAAAVHAGVLRPGEFGFVRVTIADGQQGYPGSTRNDIVSQPYGQWDSSFTVAIAPRPWTLRLPDEIPDASGMVNLSALRGQTGVSFSLKVVGVTGSVRGAGVYTDDSSLGAAAVHAGILKLGESGWVKVTLLPGQQGYTGSDQNGIKSLPSGKTPGAFQLDKGSK
ncbi:MAG TPA: LCCL domain-containing protein [Vicinamibacterales bacterium]|nr:LCCL domain-containing protein [Vicinamibacterales bacterium]